MAARPRHPADCFDRIAWHCARAIRDAHVAPRIVAARYSPLRRFRGSPNGDAPMPTHTGSCHCGRIAFEVEGDIDSALACNCSICSRKGSLLWFVPRDKLKLKTPEDAASTYEFNKHVIKHRFCPTCGIHPYGEGKDPKGNATAAINLRCIEHLDLASIPVHHFDGRSL
jgi:hypothetical protein